MLGQMTMFAPDATLPLRKRVTVERVELAQVRVMLERFHYLHRVRTGGQLNYAVLIDGVVDGVITYAYPMVIGKIAGVPTDEVIEFARMYLHQNIPHSATCAIGQTLRRIGADWLSIAPHMKPPRLVVSWSDATVHKGTVYKAANFEHYHRSTPKQKGEGGWARAVERADFVHEKDCWLYWLGKKGGE